MADIGYIYVNSVGGYVASSDIEQAVARLELTNPDDLIIYIEKSEGVNLGAGRIKVNSNTYYILGKGNDTTIKGSAFYVWTRGEQNGARYDSTDMDGFSYADCWDSTGNFHYSMGGSGGNGRIDYNAVTNQNAIPIRNITLKNNQSTVVNFVNSPNVGKPFIGFTNQQLVDFDIRTYMNYPEKNPNFAKNVKVSYMNNVYSQKYYDYKKDDIAWWTDFQDIRTFYKTNHLYFNVKYGDVTPIVPAEEYADDYFVFDGYPLFLNLHTTHNLESAQKYLRDGTIPSDDTYVDSEDGNPKVGPDADSGGDDDDMDGMNNTSHNSNQSIIKSPTSNYYILEYNGLNTFCNWFWNDILTQIQGDYTLLGDYAFNMLTNAYGDLNKYVTSLRKLNVNLDTFFNRKTGQNIKIGRYVLDNFNVDAIESDKEDMPLLAQIQVPMRHAKDNKATFGNFLDYPPYTSVSIYIPFIGIVPIDGNMVVGRTIRLYGAVDVIAGTIHYNVFVQTPSKEWSLIGSYEGKCGVDIPLALDNSMQNSTNILKNVADVTTGLCSKGSSALLNVGNGIFTEPVSNLGAQTTNTTYYNPNKCALIMQSAIGTVPNNFGSTCGYIWCKSAKLSDLTGLTICKNPRIGNFDDNTPTETERTEIYSLLETGVII